MQIPSFEQFLSDIGPDYLTRVSEKAWGPLNDDPVKADPANLVVYSNLFAVELLAEYHSWLASKLSD